MKVLIGISGKKQAGKNTFANMIAAHLTNLSGALPDVRMAVDGNGCLYDANVDEPRLTIDLSHFGGDDPVRRFDVAIISFADRLKQFCIDVLGLKHAQCYGTDRDKNSLTHIKWESVPRQIRRKYATRGWLPWQWFALRSGHMTAREVMQVFGTDMVRELHQEAWAKATTRLAESLPHSVVIAPDTRFPNEVWSILGVGGQVYRLPRDPSDGTDLHPSECALDDFPLEHYDMVLWEDITMDEMWSVAQTVALSILEKTPAAA